MHGQKYNYGSIYNINASLEKQNNTRLWIKTKRESKKSTMNALKTKLLLSKPPSRLVQFGRNADKQVDYQKI